MLNMKMTAPLFMTCAAFAGMASVPNAAMAADAVVLYSAGIDGLLDDPKDSGLHAALVMMQKNGLSLPPDMKSEEVHAANLVIDALLSELDLRASMQPPTQPDGMPFGLTVSSRGNAGASAESLYEQLTTLMRMTGAPKGLPDPNHPGFVTFQESHSNAPPVWFGTETVGGDATVIVSVNTPPEVGDTDWSGSGLPSGTDPIFGMLIDFKELQPILGMAAAATPQMGEILSKWGLTGPKAMRIECAGWRDDRAMRFGGRVSNYGVHFGDLVVKGGVRNQDLRVVPSDAVAMQVTRFNMRGMFDSLLGMADGVMAPMMGAESEKMPMSPSEMMLMQAKMMVGVNPKTELIDYLGDSIVLYRSRSTGGDGLMSSVMLVELSNPDGMATSLGTLAARINAMVAPLSQGYAEVSTWSQPDCGEAIALSFPGLPVPLQVSLVVKDNWLVASLNPQAMVAACRQLGASTSVLDNPRFTSALGNDAIGTMQVNFTDLPAQLDRGYGIAVGLMSAIDNYTRPRGHLGSESRVSMILPPYNELVKDARPCVLTVRLSGDDLIYTGSGDTSVNVLITGAAANITAMMPVTAPLAAGLVMPALSSAHKRAREIHEENERHIKKMTEDFHRENEENQNHHDHDHDHDHDHGHNHEEHGE